MSLLLYPQGDGASILWVDFLWAPEQRRRSAENKSLLFLPEIGPLSRTCLTSSLDILPTQISPVPYTHLQLGPPTFLRQMATPIIMGLLVGGM
jgi:hypothetical protein